MAKIPYRLRMLGGVSRRYALQEAQQLKRQDNVLKQAYVKANRFESKTNLVSKQASARQNAMEAVISARNQEAISARRTTQDMMMDYMALYYYAKKRLGELRAGIMRMRQGLRKYKLGRQLASRKYSQQQALNMKAELAGKVASYAKGNYVNARKNLFEGRPYDPSQVRLSRG